MKHTVLTHHQYVRNLPHYQNGSAWYHITISLRGNRGLSVESLHCVLGAILFHDGKLWDVAAAVAMPTYGTHMLCRPLPIPNSSPLRYHALERIMHSIKTFTAVRILANDGGRGPVWEREYYDREIRNGRDFWGVVSYIEQNPVKESLADQPFEWSWLYESPEVRAARYGDLLGA